MQDIVLVAEILDGPKKHLCVLYKSNERSQRDGVANDLASAVPYNQPDRNGAGQIDRRVKPCVMKYGTQVRVGQRCIQLIKLLEVFPFAIEELNGDGPRQIFL